MLADDLARGIALDPLRAGVPADHATVGIEHVDGIVGDGVDQQAENIRTLQGLPKLVFPEI
jgi:hypothetical protein